MPRHPKPPRANERAAILAALSGTPKAHAAEEHGVSRPHLYQLLARTLEDPAGAVAEAEAELAFRREVERLTRAAESAALKG